jgi:hypothetical protein
VVDDVATGSGDSKRVDRLSTICTRLYLELSSRQYKPEAGHQENLFRFMLHPALPGDLRFGLHRDLVALGGDVAAMLRDKELAKLVLGSL